jgi:hypothetical protein
LEQDHFTHEEPNMSMRLTPKNVSGTISLRAELPANASPREARALLHGVAARVLVAHARLAAGFSMLAHVVGDRGEVVLEPVVSAGRALQYAFVLAQKVAAEKVADGAEHAALVGASLRTEIVARGWHDKRQPQVQVDVASSVALGAALHILAARIERATSGAERWIVLTDIVSRGPARADYGLVWLDLAADSDDEARRGLAVIKSVL